MKVQKLPVFARSFQKLDLASKIVLDRLTWCAEMATQFLGFPAKHVRLCVTLILINIHNAILFHIHPRYSITGQSYERGQAKYNETSVALPSTSFKIHLTILFDSWYVFHFRPVLTACIKFKIHFSWSIRVTRKILYFRQKVSFRL